MELKRGKMHAFQPAEINTPQAGTTFGNRLFFRTARPAI